MSHSDRRKNIIESLKQLLIKKDWDDEKFVSFLMSTWGCSRRTAREYLSVARINKF